MSFRRLVQCLAPLALFALLGVALPAAAAIPGDASTNTALSPPAGSVAGSADVRNEGGPQTVGHNVLVDPHGVVFDSRSNRPLADAMVTLIDVDGSGNGGHPGEPALVYGDDRQSVAPSQALTDVDGSFRFPLVAPGRYRVQVTPPDGHAFPSKLAVGTLPNGRLINMTGSFGGVFTVNADDADVIVDLPVDPLALPLFVEKTASRTEAQLSDTVDYQLRVGNAGKDTLTDVRVTDDLPPGLRYVRGSARMDGAPIAEPQGATSRRLGFSIGELPARNEHRITYRVAIGAGAQLGDATNRAQATSGGAIALVSNLASVSIRIKGGVFDDQAFIAGRVYMDCNANRQDDEETGIAGVRIYMEDGRFAITDAQGRYSLYDVSPRTHVLKLDATTLPAGIQLEVLDQRNAGKADSRFVDLKNGQLQRGDFAATGCSDERLQALAARAASIQPAPTVAGSMLASSVVAPLSGMDANAGFVNVGEGARLAQSQMNIVVKGPAGSALRLTVNDQALSEDRVGKRSLDAARQLAMWEYVGVALKPGENTLRLEVEGSALPARVVHVLAPGEAERLVLVAPSAAPADGGSVKLTLNVVDAAGLTVPGRRAVTLEASAGQWQVQDLDAAQPGVQTFVDNGSTQLTLVAPRDAASATLSARAGKLEGKTAIDFVAAMRPLLAIGMVEGTLNVSHFSGLEGVDRGDPFERELQTLAQNDQGSLGARAAVFLKGKVRGDYLLTMAYDTDPDTRQKLLRDIQPDQFYPVYGDESTRGFDARTTGKLYLKVERNKSYALVGDFVSPAATPTRNLGSYSRSLHGAQEHYESGSVVANGFVTHDTSRRVVVELAAKGISGPYVLGRSGMVANSEKVEILVRDRNQPAIVRETIPQSRYVDYTIETYTGRLIFNGPVASVDQDLNPRSIRVTYEIDQGGEDFITAGGDVQVQVTERINVGGSVVEDRNPQDAYRLLSANTRVQVTAHTALIAEVAQSQRDSLGRGNAMRAELVHNDETVQARVYYGRSDAGFDNPTASLNRGRSEGGARADYRLDDSNTLHGEYLLSEDPQTDSRSQGGLVSLAHRFSAALRGEVGSRLVRLATGESYTTLRGKLAYQLPDLPQASIFGEAEQDVEDADSRMLAVGGEYRFDSGTRLYGRHELISSLGGPYRLDPNQQRNLSVIGVSEDLGAGSQRYGEYRIRNALGGREGEAATGLRRTWQVREGLMVLSSFERVQTMSGDNPGNTATAVAGGVEYTATANLKASTRVEYRRALDGESWLSTASLAWKLDQQWTVLGKNTFNALSAGNQPDRMLEQFQFGAAYRSSSWIQLARVEIKREIADPIAGNRQAQSAVWNGNWQPANGWELSGRVAAKQVHEDRDDAGSVNRAALAGVRVAHDFAARWDGAINASALCSSLPDATQTALGGEVGYMLHDNLWLSAGYNLSGYRDRDLAADAYTQRGVSMRLRGKFDESLLSL